MRPGHVWYPQDDPRVGEPESEDALAILASLHTDRPWADRYLTAEDRKALRKDGV